MPALISIYLDSSSAPNAARAAWTDAIAAHRGFELLDAGTHTRSRAAALGHALQTARGKAFAWIDARRPPHLERVADAWDLLRARGAAAASLSASAATLNPLGVRVPQAPQAAEQRLFAPEGAALYTRGALALAGGFDASLAYGHEDAELGWRLALRGQTTISVPVLGDARGAAEPPPIDRARRLRHTAANELSALFLYAGNDWLNRALPAALARLLTLAASRAQLDPQAFDFGRTIPSRMDLPVDSVALLLAIEDFGRRLATLRRTRARVQQTRRQADEQLLPLFDPSPVDAEWERAAGRAARDLCELLGLDTTPARSAPSAPRRQPPRAWTEQPSRVSIVVLTILGATHLPACLTSLAQLDFPRDAVEVIVVDNGSPEDVRPHVEAHYPGARVLRPERNLGFCGGNNAGASAARHEWLLFLNDDTRADPNLLRALLATAARRRAASVGAVVVDWSGREIDFAGGYVSFEGRGFQSGIGARDLARWRRERPLLFANGAAMLIRRDVYLEAGGFPDCYFAYYEDVALGWALWLRGYEVWLSGDALVFHRHHGSSADEISAARERNLTRNALSTLTTHLGDDLLPDVLASALVMAATRMVFELGLGGERLDDLSLSANRRRGRWKLLNPLTLVQHARGELRRRGARRQLGLWGNVRQIGIRGVLGTGRWVYRFVKVGTPGEAVGEICSASAATVADLSGAAEWARSATALLRERRLLQAARQCSDREVLGRFAENWLNSVPIAPGRHAEYHRVHQAVVRHFRLARVTERH